MATHRLSFELKFYLLIFLFRYPTKLRWNLYIAHGKFVAPSKTKQLPSLLSTTASSFHKIQTVIVFYLQRDTKFIDSDVGLSQITPQLPRHLLFLTSYGRFVKVKVAQPSEEPFFPAGRKKKDVHRTVMTSATRMLNYLIGVTLLSNKLIDRYLLKHTWILRILRNHKILTLWVLWTHTCGQFLIRHTKFKSSSLLKQCIISKKNVNK